MWGYGGEGGLIERLSIDLPLHSHVHFALSSNAPQSNRARHLEQPRVSSANQRTCMHTAMPSILPSVGRPLTTHTRSSNAHRIASTTAQSGVRTLESNVVCDDEVWDRATVCLTPAAPSSATWSASHACECYVGKAQVSGKALQAGPDSIRLIQPRFKQFVTHNGGGKAERELRSPHGKAASHRLTAASSGQDSKQVQTDRST